LLPSPSVGSTSASSSACAGLETIEGNARVKAQLIDDRLDMSRITAGKLRLEVEPLHPLAFIDAAIGTVMPAADAEGIRVERARRRRRADLR
jgi:signal transduction histidine kinase